MKQLAMALALSGLAVFSISCSRPAPAPASTAAVDSRASADAAIKDIDAASAARAAALEKNDIEGVLSHYEDDAVWLPPFGEEVVGKELARERYKTLAESVQLREQQVSVEHALLAPGVMLDRGQYSVEISPRQGGGVRQEAGTYMTVWRKGADDRWRVSYQMWTSQRPFQPAGTEK